MTFEEAMDKVQECRYSENLGRMLRVYEPLEVTYLEYEDDYQGSIDIDVKCKANDWEGEVVYVSYEYSYGSCSGCDEWESRALSDPEIVKEMALGATVFTEEEYKAWSKNAERGYDSNDARDKWKQQQKA